MWPFSLKSEAPLSPDTSLESKRQRLLDEQERLLKAQSSLLAVASGQVREPLVRLQGYTTMLSEMVQEGSLEPEWANVIIGNIVNNTRALRQAVETALDTVSIEANALELECEPLSLAKLVWKALALSRKTILEKGLRIQVSDLAGLPRISGDAERLTQALGYIFADCVTHTLRGRIIEISGKLAAAEQGAGFVELEIHDGSRGPAPQERDELFPADYAELKVQGKARKGRQATIELAMARGIIEAHGGRLWTDDSDRDQQKRVGVTFYLLLPVA